MSTALSIERHWSDVLGESRLHQKSSSQSEQRTQCLRCMEARMRILCWCSHFARSQERSAKDSSGSRKSWSTHCTPLVCQVKQWNGRQRSRTWVYMVSWPIERLKWSWVMSQESTRVRSWRIERMASALGSVQTERRCTQAIGVLTCSTGMGYFVEFSISDGVGKANGNTGSSQRQLCTSKYWIFLLNRLRTVLMGEYSTKKETQMRGRWRS